MPGLHSPEKLAARRNRAVLKGYISAHSRPGRRFIEVDSLLAAEIKVMARSLERHRMRELDNGAQSHFARAASLQARANTIITVQELKQDLKLHKAANVAKHGKGQGGRHCHHLLEPPSSGCHQVSLVAPPLRVAEDSHFIGRPSHAPVPPVQYFHLDCGDTSTLDNSTQTDIIVDIAALDNSTQTDMTLGNTAVLPDWDSILQFVVNAATSELLTTLRGRCSEIDAYFSATPECSTTSAESQIGQGSAISSPPGIDLNSVSDACRHAHDLLQQLEDAVFKDSFKCNAERVPHLAGVSLDGMSSTDVVINELLRRPCTSTTYIQILGQFRATFGNLLPDLVAFLNSGFGTNFSTFGDLSRAVVRFAQEAQGEFTVYDALLAGGLQ